MKINNKRKAILESLLVEGETMIDLSPANIKTFVNKAASTLANFYNEDKEEIPNGIFILLFPTTPEEALWRIQNEEKIYNEKMLLSIIGAMRIMLKDYMYRKQFKKLKVERIMLVTLTICIVIAQCLILILSTYGTKSI